MATTSSTTGTADETSTGTGSETDNQDETSEEQDQQTTDETSGQDAEKKDKQESDKPDPRLKALRADLNKRDADLRTAQTKITELETAVKAAPSQETLDAVQSKYDRLEGFLQAVGGPLSRALDSRTFTQALFESDKDIKEIVKEYNAANPSATSTALGSAAATPAGKGPNMSDLLRAAAK